MWLRERVGPTGWVMATDVETHFLDTLGSANLEVRRHDIISDELPDRAFDLVHIRAVLERLQPSLRVERWSVWWAPSSRAVCSWPSPGISLMDAGKWSVVGPRDVIVKVSASLLKALPVDMFYGRRLATDIQACGLVDVGSEGRVGLIRGASTTSKVWPLVWATIGERLVASGGLSADELEHFLALHDDPQFTWLGPVMMAAWGQWPG